MMQGLDVRSRFNSCTWKRTKAGCEEESRRRRSRRPPKSGCTWNEEALPRERFNIAFALGVLMRRNHNEGSQGRCEAARAGQPISGREVRVSKLLLMLRSERGRRFALRDHRAEEEARDEDPQHLHLIKGIRPGAGGRQIRDA